MKVGSLFTGYGGLDLAVGGDLAWYAEIEPAACTVLAHHYPDVPNLGDITQIDWNSVEPVDVLTGGYPCQPFSHAGKRAGTDDERHLWPYVATALRTLRPMVGIFENVDGHRSLGLDVVLGDLAEMGRTARWGVVRAADAGAPHGRARVFIVTTDPARGTGGTWPGWGLLEPEGPTGSTARVSGTLADPDSASGETRRDTRHDSGRVRLEPVGHADTDWGQYGPAVRRWEALTRPAPDPTTPGRNDRPRLNPRFVEWMMGLPDGWVTGHGLRPSAELKMLGNGVCPQQARLALDMLAVAA